MRFEWEIGFRYLKAKRKQAFVSLITGVSIGGIAVGVAALIIVLGVMAGFQTELRKKILGATSHVVILRAGEASFAGYREVLDRVRALPDVAAAAPFVLGQVMVLARGSVSGAVIRGIDPEIEQEVTRLSDNLIGGRLEELDREVLVERVNEKTGRLERIRTAGIILGDDLATSLGVGIGSEVTLLTPMGAATPGGYLPRLKRFRVAGLFDTGLFEYDASLVYVSLRQAQQFFKLGDRVTGVELAVKDIFRADRVAREVDMALGAPYYARDWKEMNRSLFSAMKLEKTAMFVILVLIILVAAFNIVSTLVMAVMDKAKEIAVLKSMGATDRSIMRIFMAQGTVIGLAGTSIGAVVGYVLGRLLETYQFIHLPKDYPLDTLPVNLQLGDFVAVCAAAIGMSLLATLYPSWRASRLDPVEALRYE